jgi:hypothetical protein
LGLAQLVFDRYDTGQPIGIYPVQNMPNTHLVVLSGMESLKGQATGWNDSAVAGIGGHDAYWSNIKSAIQTIYTSASNPATIIMAGHSLGGIESENLVDELQTEGYVVSNVVTFGSPVTSIPDESVKYARFATEFLGLIDPITDLSPLNPLFPQILIGGTSLDPWTLHMSYPQSHDLTEYDALGFKGSANSLELGPIATFSDPIPETTQKADPSGFAFQDDNGNGVRDPGEPGVPNVPVFINGTTSAGVAVGFSTKTDANGFYAVDVPTGEYTISIAQPAGYQAGPLSVGSNGGIVNSGFFTNVPVGPDQPADNYNFAETFIPPTVNPTGPDPVPTSFIVPDTATTGSNANFSIEVHNFGEIGTQGIGVNFLITDSQSHSWILHGGAQDNIPGGASRQWMQSVAIPHFLSPGTYTLEVMLSQFDGTPFPNPNDGTLVASNPITIVPVPTTATIVGQPTFIFDGMPHGTTGAVWGTDGSLRDNRVIYTDSTGNSLSGPPVDPGTYTATISHTVADGYVPSSASTVIVIEQAAPTIVVQGGEFTFDGASHPANISVSDLAGDPLGVTVTYGNGISNPPVNPGTYPVTVVFSGDIDYAPADATGLVTILRAPLTASISPVSAIYDGTPKGATGSIRDALGNLYAAKVGYIDASGRQMSGAPVHAGSYTAVLSYPGDENHLPVSASAQIVIAKATPIAGVIGGVFAYDGTQHLATANVIGFPGDKLKATIAYSGSPISVGTVTATARFAGSADYNSASASALITILRATPIVTLTSASKAWSVNTPINFTVAVGTANGKVAAAGIVTLVDTTTNKTLGTANLVAGKAIVKVKFTSLGSHSVVATFAPSGGATNPFVAASSTSLTEHVRNPTSIALTVPSPAEGKSFLLKATLAGGVPAGALVRFFDNGVLIGQGTTNSKGIAQLLIAQLTRGNHSFTVAFGGNARYTPSNSKPVSLRILSRNV